MRIPSISAALVLACCGMTWGRISAAAAQRPDALPPAGANFESAARAADQAVIEGLYADMNRGLASGGYGQPDQSPNGHWRYYNPNNAWFVDNSNNWSTYDPQTYSMWQRYYPGSSYLGNRGYYDNRYFANRHYANPYAGSRYYRGRYLDEQRYYSGLRGRW